MNIDLKGYTNKYYNKVCGAKLEPVLETIKRCNDNCHVEIANFIASVNENIPLHLSRYFPRYKMENEATKIEKITAAQKEAKKYLKYVYVGNVGGVDNNTYCPKCGALLVGRDGYSTEVCIKGGRCERCGEEVYIIM